MAHMVGHMVGRMVGHMEVELEHTEEEVLDMAMEHMLGHKVDMAFIHCSCRSSRVRMKKHLEWKKQTHRESMRPFCEE